MKTYPYACALCQESFSTAPTLVSHVQNKHVPVKYSDAKNEDANSIIEYDMRKRLEDRSMTDNNEQIEADSRIHQKINRQIEKQPIFSCTKCDKTYSANSTLQKHFMTHEEKKYSCESCKKMFSYPHTLKAHERIHTGEKPYACRFCDNKFRQQNHRQAHETTHTGDMPYTCRFCDRKFPQNENRKQHERRHTGEKPYACGLCDMKFAVKHKREQHEKNTGTKKHNPTKET